MAVPSFQNIFGTQLLMLLCLSSFASGINDTAPHSDDQPVGWQIGGDNRGTWAIISNCLSTIIACTWSIQHLNVPAKPTTDGVLKRMLRSCKWMLINTLFPEFIVLQAAFELLMAMKALNQMADNGKDVAYPWWYHRDLWPRFHGLPPTDCENQIAEEGKESEEVRKWTLTHSFFANMGGLYYEHEDSQFPLTALQIAAEQNRAQGSFEHPEMSEEDIRDKSKQDWFTKLIAGLQFSQLVLSLIVRTHQRLAFSQLEAITLGFAICGVTIYLIYLYKPQNVGTPFKVERRIADGGSIQYEKTFESFWEILLNRETNTADMKSVDRIKNDNIPIAGNSYVHPAVFFLALTSGLFGAIHAIAWTFEFPTVAEKICWQAATVIAAGSPMAGLITIPFAQWVVSSGNPQGFMADCLRLLREYSWYACDEKTKKEADEAYNTLEQIYKNEKTDGHDMRKPYKDIFLPEFRTKFLGFIQNNEDPTKILPSDLHPDFIEQFSKLCDLMSDKGAKKLCKTAKTNVHPQKNLLPKACNLSVLFFTSTLYCVARLMLLAISISSLRRMPKSVYLNTPWTKFIPSLGSMS